MERVFLFRKHGMLGEGTGVETDKEPRIPGASCLNGRSEHGETEKSLVSSDAIIKSLAQRVMQLSMQGDRVCHGCPEPRAQRLVV